MKLLHIPVLLCSCIRPALYNIEKYLRFVQDQAGHGTNSHLCQDEQQGSQTAGTGSG